MSSERARFPEWTATNWVRSDSQGLRSTITLQGQFDPTPLYYFARPYCYIKCDVMELYRLLEKPFNTLEEATNAVDAWIAKHQGNPIDLKTQMEP